MVKRDLLNDLLTSPALTEFLSTYNVALTAFLGIATLTVLALLFYNIAKLSRSADNERQRQEAISGILVCLVCTGILGGLDAVYALLISFVFGMG